jgi:hypothetical protein
LASLPAINIRISLLTTLFSQLKPARPSSSSCALSAFPGNLRAMCTGVRRGMRSRMPEGTSLFARMRSAVRIALCVALVKRSGGPGPLPANIILPFFSVRLSRFVVSRGVEIEGLAA